VIDPIAFDPAWIDRTIAERTCGRTHGVVL